MRSKSTIKILLKMIIRAQKTAYIALLLTNAMVIYFIGIHS